MDGYEALFDEIKSFLKSLDDKIDLVIKTRNILNKETTTIPKETSTHLINNLFLVEDSLRDSCRIINKCLSFHKIQGIQTKPISASIPFATSNIYQSSPHTAVKEHKDELYNFKGLTETSLEKESNNTNTNDTTANKKEKDKTQIKQTLPTPKDTHPPLTKHNVRKEILFHNKGPNVPVPPDNNNVNANNKNKISKNQSKQISNNNNNNIKSNKPKLFFAYDNSEQEISQISSNVVPSSNTHPPPEYGKTNINSNANIIESPLYNANNNTNKQIQLYTEKTSNKQSVSHHTDETENTSFPSCKRKVPAQNENDYLSSDIPLHNNITINNLILSSNTDNKKEKDTAEHLNPIDTASKIKQKATKVSELVVLISANEDLFEMLSQLYDMNIIDLLLSDDIDDTTIDSIYAAIGEIERLKQNDIEEDISENENED